MVGYYRKFIPGFALIAKPLHGLFKKNANYDWSQECQASFESLINHLCDDVTLRYPDFAAAKNDPKRALIVQTDASRDGIAGILGQLNGHGKVQPISFVSRACTSAESNYPSTELEAMAVRFAVRKFSPYIIGIPTIVETDHSALVQMFGKPSECGNARVNKWAMEINSMYDLEFRYKAGKTNSNADALSRAVPVVCATGLVEGSGELPEGIGKDAWVSEQIDGEFGSIYKYIDQRILPTEPEVAKVVINSLPRFTLIDRILYYVDPETSALRLVVPEPYTRQLFHERHGGLYGTHSSAPKIPELLRRMKSRAKAIEKEQLQSFANSAYISNESLEAPASSLCQLQSNQKSPSDCRKTCHRASWTLSLWTALALDTWTCWTAQCLLRRYCD